MTATNETDAGGRVTGRFSIPTGVIIALFGVLGGSGAGIAVYSHVAPPTDASALEKRVDGLTAEHSVALERIRQLELGARTSDAKLDAISQSLAHIDTKVEALGNKLDRIRR